MAQLTPDAGGLFFFGFGIVRRQYVATLYKIFMYELLRVHTFSWQMPLLSIKDLVSTRVGPAEDDLQLHR